MARTDPIAAAQYGLVTTSQALACGLTRRQLSHARAQGDLLPVHRGVLRDAAVEVTTEQQVLAAVLASGNQALASHRAAAWTWGLTPAPTIETLVPNSLRVAHEGVLVHRTRLMPEEVIHRRIPCTGALRTVVDCGAVVPDWQLADMIDRGCAARLFTPGEVAAELARVRQRGRTGVRRVDRVLDEHGVDSTRSRSFLNRKMARLLRRAGVPVAVAEHPVQDGRYYIDFAWPELKLAVEVDGWAVHGTPTGLRNDLHRQNELIAQGWTLLRFTWDDVCHRPEWVAQQIVGMLVRLAA